MRLLHFEHGEFVLTEHDIPPAYTILSHTWAQNNSDEVTYNDIVGRCAADKPGFRKLTFIRDQSQEDGIEHFWIDTCCINRTTELELSASIRAMFKWYESAQCCYVYLSDVARRRHKDDKNDTWQTQFTSSRWFQRGWTLQELIAPSRIQFFARNGDLLGDRLSLSALLVSVTNLPVETLQGRWREFKHRDRLSWVAGRTTKVSEDLSYCLTGLCEVGIDARYGEGSDEARRRLEDEIRIRYGTIALELPVQGPAPYRSGPRSDGQRLNDYGVSSVTDQIATGQTLAKQKLRDTLMSRLRFDTMETRRSVIRKPLTSTCEWVLADNIYRSWSYDHAMVQGSGLFWIKGKPGVGKSVLVKFIHQHFLGRATEKDVILSFYFNARGGVLEKSFLGLYRSLVFQLLSAIETLRPSLDVFADVESFDASQLCRLQEVLTDCISRVKDKRIYCFIDALDECAEEDVHGLLDLFREMHEDAAGKQRALLTCFASRHYPILDVPTALQLVLEDASGHVEDLVKYVREKLSRGSPRQIRELQDAVIAKANGVFLWAAVVVDILAAMIRKGRLHELQRRLEETPRGLTDLFQAILTRDNENIDETLLALRWILFCYRPLQLTEFYFAMMSSVDPGRSQELDFVNVTKGQMESYLIDTSKGLAELAAGNRVQLIHESVRHFLLTHGGLQLVGQESTDTYADGHEALKQGCIKVLQGNEACKIEVFPAATMWETAYGLKTCNATVPDLTSRYDTFLIDLPNDAASDGNNENDDKGDDDRDLRRPLFNTHLPTTDCLSVRLAIQECYPFFNYATNFVLFHTDAAALQLPQTTFLEEFQLDDWRKKYNLLQQRSRDMLDESLDLESVAMKLRLFNLCPKLSKQDQDFQSKYKQSSRVDQKRGQSFAQSALMHDEVMPAFPSAFKHLTTTGFDTGRGTRLRRPPSLSSDRTCSSDDFM